MAETLAPIPAPTEVAEVQIELGPADLQALICSYDWDCGIASCIVAAESGWNPLAYDLTNTTGVTGLWQIRPEFHTQRALDLGYTWDQMYDPVANTEVAWDIYVDRGYSWSAWDGSPQCWAY